MTFHGTLAAINTALATAKYTPTGNYNGTDAAGIVLQVTDTFNAIVATGSGAATNDSDSISVTVTAVNDAPVFAALNGTPTFTEGGAAVTLDNDATVSDVDLSVLNGGNGDYGGAVLTVARQGGANVSDLFQFAPPRGLLPCARPDRSGLGPSVRDDLGGLREARRRLRRAPCRGAGGHRSADGGRAQGAQRAHQPSGNAQLRVVGGFRNGRAKKV